MDGELPATARPVWQAYRAMQDSKRRHFEYLRYLEDKYSRYGQPNDAEEQRRRALLAEHDARVGEFRTALATLKQGNPEAFARLVRELTREG